MSDRNKRNGFTLIELLVVIAIIAILAAILFPVFAQARESARASSCLNNEKQITLGLLQYVQDYDERFPIWEYGKPNTGQKDGFGGKYTDGYVTWDEAIQPYLKNYQVFSCLDYNGPGNDYNDPTKDDSGWTGVASYAVNCYLTGRSDVSGNTNPTNSGAKLAVLAYPAQTVLLSEAGGQSSSGACEGVDGMEWGWMNDAKTNLVEQGATGSAPAPLQRHKGGANYAFSDGHCKWFSASSMGLQPGNSVGNPPSDASFDSLHDHSGTKTTWWPY